MICCINVDVIGQIVEVSSLEIVSVIGKNTAKISCELHKIHVYIYIYKYKYLQN